MNTQLTPRPTADGSFSLFCEHVHEGFHSAEGAVREACEKFVGPSELERFPAGSEVAVLEVAVGTGTNTAVLLEAVRARGLRLRWWGLELDHRPLFLSLAEERFRSQWQPPELDALEQLRDSRSAEAASHWRTQSGMGTLLWGDARQRLGDIPDCIDTGSGGEGFDLVFLDAFSPQRCPELWSEDFLTVLAVGLKPSGRLLTYSAAAAVRGSLQRSGLLLASIRPASTPTSQPAGPRPESHGGDPLARWSAGTAASPSPLSMGNRLQPLSPMEHEHLLTRAAEPYRDPTLAASAASILVARSLAQHRSPLASPACWRKRWGMERQQKTESADDDGKSERTEAMGQRFGSESTSATASASTSVTP